jgi:hypothetical protein
MNERLYVFKMPDGSVEMMTIKEAIELNRADISARIEEIMLNSKNKRMNKDGFEPGWQDNLQTYAGGRKEYDRLLREKGLVEIGYDTKDLKESTAVGGATNTEEFALYAKEIGVDLNDQEIDAIKSGEYFDASKCDLSGDE